MSVRLWDRNATHIHHIAESRENQKYHPGVKLESGIQPEADLGQAIRNVSYIVLSVPSHGMSDLFARIKHGISPTTILINTAKGIEGDTLKTVSMMASEIFGESLVQSSYAVLSGPSFAAEVIRSLPTALTVAAWNPSVTARIQDKMHSDTFRIFSSDDVIGVELAGALKNVIAIAAGASDGFGFGHNARAGLVTRGLAEISRIGTKMGAHRQTFAGLSGMGDLILTCTGDLSRNRRVGLKLSQGKTLRQIMKEVGQVAEGIRTAKAAYQLAIKLDVEAPILEETYQTIYQGKPLEKGIADLLRKAPESERD